ncbi:MAG: adenylate/guanylate cyclase domain-containing protein [Thermodesulfobacteriota bacterium]|nr:adenylate/guanylate cyclase domain-containing protein [Thermodesulfobacteriota bacterium]
MVGILIIDDEEGVRRSLQRVLERDNYKLFLAPDGKTGIKMVKENLYDIDIAISDLKMPGLDGLSTLIELNVINPQMTRIMLTGYATLENAINALNNGLDGYILKPFDNVEMRKNIRDCYLKKRLQQFISEQVFQELLAGSGALSPRRQKVTILFSDIRGFSAMTENMNPEEIPIFLSKHYFDPISAIVKKHGGTLDKHIGDGVMIIFGAPLSHSDDTARAIFSALEIRDYMRIHGENNKMPVGMGLNTGEVVTGVFGSVLKKEYTAFGNVVNIAAHLEKMAKGGDIFITEQTYQEVSEMVYVHEIGMVTIKNIKDPTKVYNIVGFK